MKKFSISILVFSIALLVFLSNPFTSSVITKGDVQTAEIKVGA